jgi:hypothetical protein
MSWVSLVIAASRSRSAASALPKNSSREGLRLRGAPAALAVAPGLAAGVAVAAGVRGGVRGDDGTPAEKPLASRRLRPSGVLACAAAWAALTVKVAAQAAVEKSHEDVCRLGRVGLGGVCGLAASGGKSSGAEALRCAFAASSRSAAAARSAAARAAITLFSALLARSCAAAASAAATAAAAAASATALAAALADAFALAASSAALPTATPGPRRARLSAAS